MNWRLGLATAALLFTAACARDLPLAPPIASAPTAEFAGSEVTAGLARIRWSVSAGAGFRFQVHRRLDTMPWKPMVTLSTDARGRMVLEDPSVQPGQTYSYRVRLAGDTSDSFSGEVTIDVPER